MKRIPLSRGKYATVDDTDYDYLMQWKWYYSHYGYAVRDTRSRDRKSGKQLWMHRLVAERMGLNLTNDIDHINRKKSDNRRVNLRDATRQQQMGNVGLQRNNKSNYKGVSWNSERCKWVAQIKVNGKQTFLGRYKHQRCRQSLQPCGCKTFRKICTTKQGLI